ncbi:hypothetical protein CEXT_778351 [Caerostris extrusa]|uniref:Uncharacterized protein n=1 Tax=Caerostris extrusa TaxID=172846 RepID=A0AAV4UGN2_CAEEX|nr:hypothetical protein CEXT_778351 [Caerostris extrusa]
MSAVENVILHIIEDSPSFYKHENDDVWRRIILRKKKVLNDLENAKAVKPGICSSNLMPFYRHLMYRRGIRRLDLVP